MLSGKKIFSFMAAMAVIVVTSNILVQFPVGHSVGRVNLADILTWGAFTYPVAFLVTDLTNRVFGPAKARQVVLAGFGLAVLCSVIVPKILFSIGLFPFELSTSRIARIALASGTAFLIAQMLDVYVFDQLRVGRWWRAPLYSSLIGSAIDTSLFFSLAFASTFVLLGENDGFALENAPFLGIFAAETARWISWAIGDFCVKILVGLVLLIPYGLLSRSVGQANHA